MVLYAVSLFDLRAAEMRQSLSLAPASVPWVRLSPQDAASFYAALARGETTAVPCFLSAPGEWVNPRSIEVPLGVLADGVVESSLLLAAEAGLAGGEFSLPSLMAGGTMTVPVGWPIRADLTDPPAAGSPAGEEENGAWAREEMQKAKLWDQRCVESAVALVRKLATAPEQSFSTAVGHAGRQAAHRICGNEKVSPSQLVAGHIAQTALRCRGYSLVIVDQDTTAVEYNGHASKKGLGPISKEANSRGFFIHSGFALSPMGQPLGLLSLRMWARDPATFGQSDASSTRAFAEKESYKWVECLMDVEAALDPELMALLVQDRESDVFDFMAAPRRANTQLLIRACQPRNVEVPGMSEGEDGEKGKLFDIVAKAPVAGTVAVTVPRKPGQKKRQADLTIQFTQVQVLPPANRRKADRGEPQEMTVIRAVEMNPPQGEEPVEWVLLTTMVVSGFEDACEMLRYYTLRWTIERFHYTLKSGGGIRKLQVQEAHALMNTVALYCVAAWRLMALTYLERTAPETPADQVLGEEELAVLAAYEGKPITNAGQAVIAIAKLGGFEPCPSAGHPGPKAVWVGLRKLAAMVVGWRLARANQARWDPPQHQCPNAIL